MIKVLGDQGEVRGCRVSPECRAGIAERFPGSCGGATGVPDCAGWISMRVQAVLKIGCECGVLAGRDGACTALRTLRIGRSGTAVHRKPVLMLHLVAGNADVAAHSPLTIPLVARIGIRRSSVPLRRTSTS